MFLISKQFHFSAAHQLHGLPNNHPCSRLHGHNYIVEVVLASETLNEVGFVRDYGELNKLKAYIDSTFDHRNLNTVMEGQTSAENIAKHLYRFCQTHWPELDCVRVSETPKTWAEYRE